MNLRFGSAVAALGLVALLGAAGCKRKEEAPMPPPPPAAPPIDPARATVETVKVTEVQLGSALGTDKRVTEAKAAFAPKDTIFASVTTEGTASSVELGAKWTYEDGQLVNETKRSIAPAGKEVTEFSIQKPDGWPAGKYTLEISLDGKPADSKTFTVQ